MNTDQERVFSPYASYTQTCGFCGCVFLVEIERQRDRKDVQEYCCPQCRHHPSRANTSTSPRITLISQGTLRHAER